MVERDGPAGVPQEPDAGERYCVMLCAVSRQSSRYSGSPVARLAALLQAEGSDAVDGAADLRQSHGTAPAHGTEDEGTFAVGAEGGFSGMERDVAVEGRDFGGKSYAGLRQ
jgi:hypothetical protein